MQALAEHSTSGAERKEAAKCPQGHSKDFPRKGKSKLFLHLQRREKPVASQTEADELIAPAMLSTVRRHGAASPREGHLLVMARAMSSTSFQLHGRKKKSSLSSSLA